MRIILALGNPSDMGGPTAYAEGLKNKFLERGHIVFFCTYGSLWRFPTGVRHVLYAMRLLSVAFRADAIIAFDTMTVGVPARIASFVTRTPLIVRIGGDFVWEQYVERTGDALKLSRFYQEAKDKLSVKERIEIFLTNRVVSRAQALVFNSSWLQELWRASYAFGADHSYVVENLYPPHLPSEKSGERVFVAAGRPIKLKQEALLRQIIEKLKKKYPDIGLDTKSLPPEKHQARVKNCYAVILASVSDVSPNAIIDAVVHGKPFVCTDDTGIRERLEGTGLFVDTQDEKALSDAIESLLNEEEYERIAARVRAFSFTRTWENIADDFLRIIDTVCGS